MTTIWQDLMGVQFAQRYYRVGDVSIRAIEAGDGPPLIFLHGAGGHAEAYVRNLGPHSAHFRCMAIDLVGHGLSAAPADRRYTTDEFIDCLVGFLDAAGLDRVHLSGESFGGRVAAWVAMKHPDRVDRLVLNTTGGLPVTKPRHQADVDRMLGAALAALDNPTTEAVRTRLAHLFADPGQVPDEFVTVRQAMYRRPEVSAALTKLFHLVFDPVDAERWALSPERLSAIKAPTLVIWSDHNPIFDFEDAKGHLRHIPDVRFHLVQQAGHWPQYEQAEDFNRAHLAFLLGN